MDPTLYQAAMKGDIHVLIQYQDRFESQLTPKGNTVLHIIAKNGKTQDMDRILRICPSLLGRVNSQGETPLHIAARAGDASIVQALLDFVDLQNNDIEIGRFSREMLAGKNVDGDTAFHMAVQNGHFDVVKLLLKKDSTILYLPNLNEETPLYLAGKRGFYRIVSEILKTYTSPLYGGPDGRTVLHALIIFGSRGYTTKLFNWRGSLAKEADVDGWITPLHHAAFLECTTNLLNWREDLAKEADVDGLTPLHHAARLGHAQLVKNLLHVDKSVAYLTSYENDGKNTALNIAARQGHVNVIEVLLSICPDCWEIDNIEGQNFLHIAVENKKYNVVEYISDNSSLINGLTNQKYYAGNTRYPELLAAPTDVPNTEKTIEALRKMADTHMIVAALIATVTFAAGLAVPGGYYGNDGPNPGMAILGRTEAFKIFIETNTGALMSSVIAILCYFDAARFNDEAKLKRRYRYAGVVVAGALTTMIFAFVTGTYAVLANSSDVAIPTCVYGSIIVLIGYLYYFRNCFGFVMTP